MEIVLKENGEYDVVSNHILCQSFDGSFHRVELTEDVRQQINYDAGAGPSNSVSYNSKTKTKWSQLTTKSLISIYKDEKSKFENSAYKSEAVWEIISKEMDKLQYKFSACQCKNKFVNLKRLYMKVKDNLKVTGAAPIHFDYTEEFDDLFRKDHNVQPVALCSSMNPPLIESVKPLDENLPENVPENEPIIRNKKRVNVDAEILAELKQNRLDRNNRFNEFLKLKKENADNILTEQKRCTDIFEKKMNEIINQL